MNGSRWERIRSPGPLLEYLRGKASDRKLRLFACAVARLLDLDNSARQRTLRSAIETCEAHADGERVGRKMGQYRRQDWVVAMSDAYEAADRSHPDAMLTDRKGEMADLLRCVFGNPFRPARFDPAWLAWNDGIIPKLAQAIYDERAYDRLPILGDALEEAGCADDRVLSHLRGPGPHGRGCWVVDLVLGKG